MLAVSESLVCHFAAEDDEFQGCSCAQLTRFSRWLLSDYGQVLGSMKTTVPGPWCQRPHTVTGAPGTVDDVTQQPGVAHAGP